MFVMLPWLDLIFGAGNPFGNTGPLRPSLSAMLKEKCGLFVCGGHRGIGRESLSLVRECSAN